MPLRAFTTPSAGGVFSLLIQNLPSSPTDLDQRPPVPTPPNPLRQHPPRPPPPQPWVNPHHRYTRPRGDFEYATPAAEILFNAPRTPRPIFCPYNPFLYSAPGRIKPEHILEWQSLIYARFCATVDGMHTRRPSFYHNQLPGRVWGNMWTSADEESLQKTTTAECFCWNRAMEWFNCFLPEIFPDRIYTQADGYAYPPRRRDQRLAREYFTIRRFQMDVPTLKYIKYLLCCDALRGNLELLHYAFLWAIHLDFPYLAPILREMELRVSRPKAVEMATAYTTLTGTIIDPDALNKAFKMTGDHVGMPKEYSYFYWHGDEFYNRVGPPHNDRHLTECMLSLIAERLGDYAGPSYMRGLRGNWLEYVRQRESERQLNPIAFREETMQALDWKRAWIIDIRTERRARVAAGRSQGRQRG